jgi:hypothetical protein
MNNITYQALNKLAKWRTVFAGWQLGTRTMDDPECQAVRDHREATLLMRAELSALVTLLHRNKVITTQDFEAELGTQADALSKMMEAKFPGFEATDTGLSMDPVVTANTMKGWRP